MNRPVDSFPLLENSIYSQEIFKKRIMPRKLYIHYSGELPGVSNIAILLKSPPHNFESLGETALRYEYVKRFNIKMMKKKMVGRLLADQIYFKLQNGEVITKKTRLGELSEGADIFAFDTILKESPPRSKSKNSAVSTEIDVSLIASEGESTKSANIANMLKTAKDAFTKGAYRLARRTFSAALKEDPSCLEARAGISQIYLKNQKFQNVIDLLMPDPATAHLTRWAVHPLVLELLGDAFVGLMKIPEAMKAYETALSVIFKHPDSAADVQTSRNLKVKLARALYGLKEQDAAIQIVQNIFQETEEHILALRTYALAAHERGKTSEALQILLKAIILDPNNKGVRLDLTDLVLTENGVRFLLETFNMEKQDDGVGQALAFLATVVKDNGAVRESAALYEETVRIVPTSASYALNLMHVYEIMCDYAKALSVSVRFFNANKSTAREGIGTINNEYILEAMHDEEEKEWLVKWHSGVNAYATVEEITSRAVSKTMQNPVFRMKKLERDELDHLAIYFTIVKILFVTGKLNQIPKIVHFVEVLRKAQELHKTSVRYEHAYYCCIVQLMSAIPDAPPLNIRRSHVSCAGAPIYICGDSHTLPLSWRTVEVGGAQRELTPALATGVKAWHLRERSRFYPKVNFEMVTEKIPGASDVIFVFCEIDCREGILLAVEKDRYETVEDGIKHVIGIYMRKLATLITRKKFQAFIHPVIPVLNETRAMVMKFNHFLKIAVNNREDMTWLDFVDELLDDAGYLKKCYELDGTHLSPSYVPLFEGALENAMRYTGD